MTREDFAIIFKKANEHTERTITGQREKILFSIYVNDDFSSGIDTEKAETFLFEPIDVLNIMVDLNIPFTYRDMVDDIYETHEETIETENLIFFFYESEFKYVARKYNVLDELRAKYNLPL